MSFQSHQDFVEADERAPRDWVKILARYREPMLSRSIFEIAVTLAGFLGLWALAWAALPASKGLALLLAVLNGFFVVRLFLIQHDCGHYAFFKAKETNDWVGRALSILTLTPYDVWRKSHATHHASTGNLDRRGFGDINTLTVQEYRALDRVGRLKYRLYRHPVVMFGFGPAYTFLLENRLPFGYFREGREYWLSSIGTNIGAGALLTAIWWFGGFEALLWIWLPSVIAAGTIGIWLFYVQHQFEDTVWEREPDWKVHDAALHGSSHYVLPPVLQWLTANIGIHHVHHLYSRIPFYRLTEVLRDQPQLAEAQRLTVRESLGCVGLDLWDEKTRKLISFTAARTA